ncbi:Protein translocase subunit SecA [Koleobacter methoxysyntrophicus]|uniref:Protein translocase subunit SecA n=1 Tax=Koleobacter methoxysyntrophicus TaxID=2751313 RepID=A0A8A0RJN1_9FIRM|nr:HEAT repeat domain-containing protein [Koleobacter methoxysyntrophicus]QSQ07850.1 Protein translocase subunit SecA [Koleobacter methoxysyntrophicus]
MSFYFSCFLPTEMEMNRKYAVEFFSEGYIKDEKAALLLLDVYEKNEDQEENHEILYYVSTLPQTRTSLIRLNKITAVDYNSISHIDKAIISADLELLRSLPDIRPKMPENKKILDKRFNFSAMETEELWEQLWQHSRSGMGKGFGNFDYTYGELIIKEISSRKDFPYGKFMEMISHDYPEDYTGWDDTYLCVLAGELKSEDSIPFLIKCMKIDGDFICERAAEALTKIGTAKVVDAIAREYMREKFHFRLYAIGALGNIKSEESEQLMLELLPEEKDVTLKTSLGFGLCKLFSIKGIPMVLTLLKYGYDTMLVNLEEAVYVNHVVNGLEHPQMHRWKESIDREERRIKEAKRKFFNGDIDVKEVKKNLQDLFIRRKEIKKLNESYSKGFKVGRNDPCPCGSGKKFKKCCGK